MTVSLQNKIFLMMASPFLFSFASYAAEKTPAWSPTVLGYEPMTPGLLGDWGEYVLPYQIMASTMR